MDAALQAFCDSQIVRIQRDLLRRVYQKVTPPEAKPFEPTKLLMQRHGTYARYQHLGCRCQSCKAANARYTKVRRKPRPRRLGREMALRALKLTDADVLRLQRLAYEGMSKPELAVRFGISVKYVDKVLRGICRAEVSHVEA